MSLCYWACFLFKKKKMTIVIHVICPGMHKLLHRTDIDLDIDIKNKQ